MSVSRRQFLQIASAQGAILIIGIRRHADAATAESAAQLAPNQWLAIDEAGTVFLSAHKSEMGQGVRTALPMILADELGADWQKVVIVAARPSPQFPNMGTSGSGSMSGSWLPLRRAAATARQMLVSAAATSWNVPVTDCITEDGNVVHRPSGRRQAFGTLVVAASALPVSTDVPLRQPDEFRIVGRRVTDPEVKDIVRGSVRYGIDVQRPGMLYATIARCPVHGGRVRSFDERAVRSMPGVRHVARIGTGVAVIADSTWAAIKARDVLQVDWEEGPNATLDTAHTWRLLEEALARGGKVARSEGDAPTALANAGRVMQAEYRWSWNAHAAIEPLNAVADVRPGGCEIWAGTQSPNRVQADAAALLGIPAEQVTVNVMRLGGGFGRRIADDYVMEAVEASRAAGAPVQVVWTREDDFQHDMYNPAQLNRMSAALGPDGVPIAWLHRVGDFHLSMFGAFNPNSDPASDGDPWGGFDSPYAFPNQRVELAVAESPVPSGAWRAVTYPAAVIARECFLDEIAHAIGRDPVALRLSLIPSPGTQRGLNNGDRLRRVITTAAERAGWGQRPAAVPQGRRWGRGFACNPYHQQTMVAQCADVSVGPQGDVIVHRVVTAVDCGLAVNRSGVDAQVEGGVMWALSALLGNPIEFERGRTRARTFADYPVLRIRQAPVIEVHVVESGNRPFGLGEPPVPPVGPAVLNAIFAATGKRIRRTPIRAQDLVP